MNTYEPLRIWHVDTDASRDAVDGVAAYVNAVAVEQCRAGHAVTVFSRVEVSHERRAELAQRGIRVVQAQRGAHSLDPRPVVEELRRERPDVVQIHGAWIPRMAAVAALLRRAGIPYVYTPHGGLASAVRSTKRLRRWIYTAVAETPLVTGAAAVAPVVASEMSEIAAIAPGFSGHERVVMPPVRPIPEEWMRGAVEPPRGRPRVLFLGRFEPFQKGIDDLVEMARHAPDVDVELYGSTLPEDQVEVDHIRRKAPGNVTFHPPVFGEDKIRLLRSGTLYVQLSRFEGFPVSIGEAMTVGLPCAVSERLGMAALFRTERVGAVLPTDPAHAAEVISRLAHDEVALARYAGAGREFASDHLSPVAAAEGLVELYRAAVGTPLTDADVALEALAG